MAYLEDDKRTESINFYEEGDNLEIRLYGQVKEHRYNLERGLDYVKLEDKTYTDYPLSKIYTLRKSSDISYYYITSSYSNNGYGSCFNLDEKGRIIETADNIPYVCSKDNLLKIFRQISMLLKIKILLLIIWSIVPVIFLKAEKYSI